MYRSQSPLPLFIWSAAMALGALLIFSACDDEPVLPPSDTGGLSSPQAGVNPSGGAPAGATPVVSAGQESAGAEPPPPPLDQGPPPLLDQGPQAGAAAQGGAPSGGAPPDEPVSCDPRLRAQSCEVGSSCWPLPGGRAYEGECVAGDDCELLSQTGCPSERPLCQLDGRATRCVEPMEPPLTEGMPCLTEDNRALPCAEGLICNLSVCVPSCDPSAPESGCLEERRCVDLSERLGRPVGYCGFLGLCDPFTGLGCEPQQSCRFALRPDDQRLVTFCAAEGLAGEGEACVEGAEGAQACATGLICIGSGSGATSCRRTCDTGAYTAPCPLGQACRELLSLGPNLPIRGIGLCVTNP